MFKKIRNIKINYKQYGKGEDVVLLHGWGQNIEMMKPLGDSLADHYRITIIDLPGFGLSKEPLYAFTIFDYTEVVHELLMELKINNPIMMGHSFGGRISIVYASKYKVNKLVLFGSPCVRHEYKSVKQSILKALKKVKLFTPLVNFMKKHTGSVDYRNASPMMRDILVKTVNQDLSENAKKIKCPTLLIWGENDEAVPVSEAKELDNLLMDSALIILPGTHYCYLENLNQVVNILYNFI
jgi:pimeloyl-ACP methyl ester carboxylesterase